MDAKRDALVELLRKGQLPKSTVKRVLRLSGEKDSVEIIASLIMFDIEDPLLEELWNAARLYVQLHLQPRGKRYLCTYDRRPSVGPKGEYVGTLYFGSFQQELLTATAAKTEPDLVIEYLEDCVKVKHPSLSNGCYTWFKKGGEGECWPTVLDDSVRALFGGPPPKRLKKEPEEPLPKRPKKEPEEEPLPKKVYREVLVKRGGDCDWEKKLVPFRPHYAGSPIHVLIPKRGVGELRVWTSGGKHWFSVTTEPMELNDRQLYYLVKYFIRYIVGEKYADADALRRDKLLAYCARDVREDFYKEDFQRTFRSHFI